MKNIIICGPPRAGKTTLSKRISEELGHFIIPIDKLAATFGRAYPQLDIRLAWDRDKTTANIAPFLGHFLGMFTAENGIADYMNLRGHNIKGNKFALEGVYVDLEQIAPILKMYGIENLRDSFVLIGLSQHNKTIDEFARDIKKYDTEDDWMYGFSDDDIREICEYELRFSREMTARLTEFGFTVYDTSWERHQVYDKIMEDIKMKLENAC